MRTPDSSAIVAKLLTTSACHSRTARIPLHPVLAFGTLLELGSLREFDEGFIIFVETIIDTVFLAGHSYVVVASTSQAVMLLAGRTSVVIQGLIELEDGLTACSGTPGGTCVILLYELVKGEFLELLPELSIYIAEYLIGI